MEPRVDIPRRRMRRPLPVAGGIPTFESHPLPILEGQPKAPSWVWFSIGAGVMGLTLALAAAAALAAWFDRVFGRL
jgi:hypothetical protein